MKKKKATPRTDALKQAKVHFGKAIELNSEYLKPHYHRMMIYKEEEEYEEAVKDAKRIQELDPCFKGISSTIYELESL